MNTEQPKLEMPPYKPPSPPPIISPPVPYKTKGEVPRAARPDSLQGWGPTSDLRWNGKVLEQQWIHADHDAREHEFQWVAVPHT